MEIILIAAMAANRVIGRGSEIPWHLPGEQKRFKEITWGYPLIMGRSPVAKIVDPLLQQGTAGRIESDDLSNHRSLEGADHQVHGPAQLQVCS